MKCGHEENENNHGHECSNLGAQGARPPHFSKNRAKCPFSCNLVTLLKNTENAKMNRKIEVSGDFRRSKFQNSRGSMPPDPPSCSHCLTPLNQVLNITSRKTAKVPLYLCAPPPTSYVPDNGNTKLRKETGKHKIKGRLWGTT